jgi:hypothetical protein
MPHELLCDQGLEYGLDDGARVHDPVYSKPRARLSLQGESPITLMQQKCSRPSDASTAYAIDITTTPFGCD